MGSAWTLLGAGGTARDGAPAVDNIGTAEMIVINSRTIIHLRFDILSPPLSLQSEN